MARDGWAEQSSLKCIPEQTELQTVPDSPELPASIREDREAFFPQRCTLHSVQMDESIKMMRCLHNCFRMHEIQL